MKKLLLLLLVSNFVKAQSNVEIRLVDMNVGYPIYTWGEFGYTSTNISNDAGLNAILNTYGVTHYEHCDGHPYPPYTNRMSLIIGSYPTQFITDLLDYSSVVESVKITNNHEFTDALRLQLISLGIGSPTGTSGGIIVTNDSGLNTIFQNFNVFYYVQSYPASSSNNILRYYDVVCNCDKNLLNTALLNYNSVIQTTETINGGFALSNHLFEKPKVVIYPNPFSDNYNIETGQTITNFSITDITGKTIANTSSKAELDNQSSQLSAGMYILILSFDNGKTANYKLIKK